MADSLRAGASAALAALASVFLADAAFASSASLSLRHFSRRILLSARSTLVRVSRSPDATMLFRALASISSSSSIFYERVKPGYRDVQI